MEKDKFKPRYQSTGEQRTAVQRGGPADSIPESPTDEPSVQPPLEPGGPAPSTGRTKAKPHRQKRAGKPDPDTPSLLANTPVSGLLDGTGTAGEHLQQWYDWDAKTTPLF